MDKENKRPRKAWSTEGEELLIELWEEKIEDLRGIRKNTHVYKEIAAELQRQGFLISSAEVKIKISNLTAKYRKCKADVGPSGGSPAEWVHFNRVHRIIGGFRINNIDVVVEESIQTTNNYSAPNSQPLPMEPLSLPTVLTPSSNDQISPASSLSSPVLLASMPTPSPSLAAGPGKKHKSLDKIFNMCSKLDESFNTAIAQQNAQTEEIIEIEKEKLKVIKDIQSDTRRLTDGFLNFLQNH